MNTVKLAEMEDIVADWINTFPTLFADKSYEDAEFKVLEQIFNVIGNGIGTPEDLVEKFSVAALPPSPVKVNPLLVSESVNSEDILLGYDAVATSGPMKGSAPMGAKVVAVVRASDKVANKDANKYSDVACWIKLRPIVKSSLYPNFQKEYSTYHQIGEEGRGMLPKSWIQAAQRFYTKCSNMLEASPAVSFEKFGVFPTGDVEVDRSHVEAMRKRLETYRKPGDNEEVFNRRITEAYCVKYDGNVHDLLCEMWKKRKAETIAFLEETSGMLATHKKSFDARASSPKRGRFT